MEGADFPLAAPMTYEESRGRLLGNLPVDQATLSLWLSLVFIPGMNGPRPSTRAFLCDLPCLAADSKIRFLGCVKHYNVTVGHLVLEHNYPRSKSEPSTVSVDINAVLESLKAEDLRVGTWLNVLGYVRDSTIPESSFSSSQPDSQQSNSQSLTSAIPIKVASRPVFIEAVMVFPAGAIELGEYERILRHVKDVESRIHYPE